MSNSEPVRPFTRLSAVLSLDGKLHPEKTPEFKFGSDTDRKRLWKLREKSDAIVIGSGTLAVDSAPKTVRNISDPALNPLNVICSTSLKIDFTLPWFRSAKTRKLILTTSSAPSRNLERARRVVEVIQGPEFRGLVDLRWSLQILAQRGLKNVLLEGGGKMNHSAVQANLVDELHLTLSPFVLGGTSNAALCSGPAFDVENLPEYTLLNHRKVANELFLTYGRGEVS